MPFLHYPPSQVPSGRDDGTNLRVLVVDDNEAIHADFRKILGSNAAEAAFDAAEAEVFGTRPMLKPRLAFELTFASQGQEALARVQAARQTGLRYSVVFMDVRMPPGWDGLETTVKLWEVDPDLQVVICTAFSDKSWEEMMERISHPERLLILKKPFDAIEVLQMAHALSEKWSLLQTSRFNMEELERTVDTRTQGLKNANALLNSEIASHKATEGAFFRSQQRFADFFENASVGLLQIRADGVIDRVNKAQVDLLGYTKEQCEGHHISEFQIDAGSDGDFLQLLLAGQTLADFEARLRCADGSIKQVLIDANSLWEIDEFVHIRCFMRDDTARKQAEKKLRESEENMAAAQRMAHFGSWELDLIDMEAPGANPLRWSDETFRIFGYEPGSVPVTNELFFNAVPPEDHPAITAAVSAAIAGRTSCSFVHRVKRSTGDERFLQATAHFMESGTPGRSPKLIGTVLDVTERKLSEEALKLHGRVLESMAEGVMVWDQNGVIIFLNAACRLIFGYKKDELPGRHFSVLQIVPPDESRPLMDQLSGHLQDNGAWMGELICRKKDGTALVTKASVSCLEIAGSMAFVVVMEDVSEKKNMEVQMLRSQRMESVGRLSSGIAHDLNNILTPILMCAFMLRGKLPQEEFERALETIESSTQRGADLIRQLLTFGRGTSGLRCPVPVSDLVCDLSRMIRETFPRNITFSSITPPENWTVLGDPTQLQQVMLNLCVNARDAMPAGGTLTIEVKNVVIDKKEILLHLGAGPGPHVLLLVTDTGEGIPPEVIEKIFDPFFSTKPPGKGTGLGLSTVMGIVKSHHGFLNLRSSVGLGTTFEVYLPASPKSDETPVRSVPAAPAARPHKAHGELILVVDDEASIRKVVELTLLAHGYRALVAKDGIEAMALYSRHGDEIKAIVTDIVMPSMDGVALIKVLTEMNPSVKVIATSGIGDSEGNEDKATELSSLGVKCYLRKPFAAAEILTALHELLHES
jgi:PAS domain S-box-containing protein